MRYGSHTSAARSLRSRIGTVALLVVVAIAATGCGDDEPTPEVAERPVEVPQRPVGDAPAGSDLAQAQALLDQGQIPQAVEPLRRAAAKAGPNREEIEFLLNQAVAASREETAEARIAEMRDARFEAFVERGELSKVPFFDDPRIDAYFRKVLLSKRPEAREIRERRRG